MIPNGEVQVPESIVQESITIQNLIKDLDKQNLDILYEWSLEKPDLSFSLLMDDEMQLDVTDLRILIQTFKLASFLDLDDALIARRIAKLIEKDNNLVSGSYTNKFLSYLKCYFVQPGKIQEPEEIVLGDWELIKILSHLSWTDENINNFLSLFFPGQDRQDIFLRLNQKIGNVEPNPELVVRKFIGNAKIYEYQPDISMYCFNSSIFFSSNSNVKLLGTALKGEQCVFYENLAYCLTQKGHFRILSYDGTRFIVSEEIQNMTFSKIWKAGFRNFVQSTNGGFYEIYQGQHKEITLKLVSLNFQVSHISGNYNSDILIFGCFVGQPAGLYKLVQINLAQYDLVLIDIPELIGVNVVSIVSYGLSRNFVIHCSHQGRKFLIRYNSETNYKNIENSDKIVLNTYDIIADIWYLDGAIHVNFNNNKIIVPEEIKNKIKKIEAVCATFDFRIFILTDDGGLWECRKNSIENINAKFGNAPVVDITPMAEFLFVTTI